MDANKQDASSRFVTVFEGDTAEAVVLQAVLQGQGFHVVVAHQNTKGLPPFTGFSGLDMTLQVPEGQVSDAVVAIEAARVERDRELAESGAQPSEPPPEHDTWNGETAGRRLRWWAVILGLLMPVLMPTPLGLPGALFFSAFYLEYRYKSRRLESPPSQDSLTHGLSILVLVWSVILMAYFFAR